jgi:hypothetical protein
MITSIEESTMKAGAMSRELTGEEKFSKGELACSPSLDLTNMQTHLESSTKSQLATLPTELHLKIFKYLPRISSACLGVTCKVLYRIHWSIHGRVQLEDEDDDANGRFPFLLQYWMTPLVLLCHAGTAKFVTVEKLRVRRQQDQRLRRERVEDHEWHRREREVDQERERRERQDQAEYDECVRRARF